MKVQGKIDLYENDWWLCYEGRNESIAYNVLDSLQRASQQIGMHVEEPYMFGVQTFGNKSPEFE